MDTYHLKLKLLTNEVIEDFICFHYDVRLEDEPRMFIYMWALLNEDSTYTPKYIGQTVVGSYRWQQERNMKKARGMILPTAIKKYGSALRPFIIKIVDKKQELNYFEYYYWLKFSTASEYGGYNVHIPGTSRRVHPADVLAIQEKLIQGISGIDLLKLYPEFTSTRITKINNGQTWLRDDLVYPLQSQLTFAAVTEHIAKLPGDPTKAKHTVYQYDLDGNFVAKYDSAYQAAKLTGAHRGHINECILNGTSKTCAGSYWSLLPPAQFKFTTPVSGKHGGKLVYQYTLDWKYVGTFRSCHEAARRLNCPTHDSSIATSARNSGRLTACGFRWSYAPIN